MSNIESQLVQRSSEVEDAIMSGLPVVALESTVYSNLGLPSPENERALRECLEAIRASGSVPCVTAVIDGQMRAGLEDHEYERILGKAHKVAERDLAVAVAKGSNVGATTVSASLAIAAAAGVQVFATGGIGGVHRGSEVTGDISADLGAIARHGVVTISAGIKSFLDLGRSLEMLETLGVTVLGWQTNTLPSFTARSSAFSVPHCIDAVAELAHIARIRTGAGQGTLVVNPVPEQHALDQKVHDDALEAALNDAATARVEGAAITPFVLARIAEVTQGASVPANVALVANNARLGGELAAAIQQQS